MKRTADRADMIDKSKKALGRELSNLRKISLRKMAEMVKIPPSNLKYIEDGVNAPSPEVYASLIQHLQPSQRQRKKMDGLYSSIREAPPPDVCNIMIRNADMNGVIRLIDGMKLTAEQIDQMEALVQSFPSVVEAEKE